LESGLRWVIDLASVAASDHPLLFLWLYPVRTAMVLGTLIFFWPAYQELCGKVWADWKEALLTLGVGVLVYLVLGTPGLALGDAGPSRWLQSVAERWRDRRHTGGAPALRGGDSRTRDGGAVLALIPSPVPGRLAVHLGTSRDVYPVLLWRYGDPLW